MYETIINGRVEYSLEKPESKEVAHYEYAGHFFTDPVIFNEFATLIELAKKNQAYSSRGCSLFYIIGVDVDNNVNPAFTPIYITNNGERVPWWHRKPNEFVPIDGAIDSKMMSKIKTKKEYSDKGIIFLDNSLFDFSLEYCLKIDKLKSAIEFAKENGFDVNYVIELYCNLELGSFEKMSKTAQDVFVNKWNSPLKFLAYIPDTGDRLLYLNTATNKVVSFGYIRKNSKIYHEGYFNTQVRYNSQQRAISKPYKTLGKAVKNLSKPEKVRIAKYLKSLLFNGEEVHLNDIKHFLTHDDTCEMVNQKNLSKNE